MAHPSLEFVSDELLFRDVSRLAKREDPAALAIVKLLADRRGLLSSAHARGACRRSILDWLGRSGLRALVFHETIEAARASHEYLTTEARVQASLDHSELSRDDREAAMHNFRVGRAQVLVAVKAVDEGVDVPDASVAVIAAGSRTRRQRIQRVGRVLRPVEGKQALILTILVRNTPEEAAVGGRDEALFGANRVRHHRWPGTPVSDAIRDGASTYAPDQPDYSVEDLLTLLELGLWEPGKGMVARNRRMGGGYSAREVQFSPNAWHRVDEVRAGIGVPPDDFDRLRREIRHVFQVGLDPRNAADPSVMHGSEIEAVRRRWSRRT